MPDHFRPSKNKRRVDLHSGRAGLKLCIGIGSGENAAGGDDGHSVLGLFGDKAQGFGGFVEERAAAEATGFLSMDGFECWRPGDGGVGNDQAIDAGVQADGRDGGDLVCVEIRSQFEEKRGISGSFGRSAGRVVI